MAILHYMFSALPSKHHILKSEVFPLQVSWELCPPGALTHQKHTRSSPSLPRAVPQHNFSTQHLLFLSPSSELQAALHLACYCENRSHRGGGMLALSN